MSISTNLVSGLASGFDWRAMIDQLIAVEHRKVDLVEGRKSEAKTQLSEWQTFNTSLLALKTAAESLKDPDDFNLFSSSMSTDSATVDAEDLLSVSTSSSAAPGTYTVKVTNLATAQKLSSNPFTSGTTELGSSYAGDIIVNGKVVTINSTDTLANLAYSINSLNTGTDPSGVTASIVNYGANDYRLILTSDTTGEDGISLLNGSSANLLQKYGWKDKESAVVKNSITQGAQSDRFTAHNVAIKSLLGLSTGEASTGTLLIDDVAVTIDLDDDSLTDIKDAITQAMIDEEPDRTDIVASVVSETVDGTTYYRLQIEGTETFVDENNILNTLGILHNNSALIAAANTEISANEMTTDGAYITPDTLLVDIDGYISLDEGNDEITFGGAKTGGQAVSYEDFSITSSTTVQDLLDAIETQYATTSGDVVAYVTSEGKIQVDDVAAGGSLNVILTDVITNGELEFVDGNGAFGDADSRNREVVGGADATVMIDGVEVTDSSNNIDDVIPGVTLNLISGDSPTTTVTLSIERDIDSIKANIQTFADKYNEVMSYINTQFSFDGESEETGGALFGDATLRSVKADLTALLTENIWGVNSDYSTPGLVGVEMNSDLEMSIDDTILTGYLKTNFNDVKSLFVGQGSATNSFVTYIGHTRDTKAGDYDVHINRAATRGTETGNVDLVSSGAANAETLTITQGNDTAAITISAGDKLSDIKNTINAELDTEYTETLVGSVMLYSDVGLTTEITSETTWDSIYDGGGILNLGDGETISFSGYSRSGSDVSGSYEIDTAADTVQDLLSAMENAFASKVTASIDTSGRIVITDEYGGYSQLAISSISHSGAISEGEFFGEVDVTAGAGDGSQQGRYAMAITATDDGSDHLVLRSDVYGDTSFTISQDTTNNNYYYVLYGDTSNTTETSNGTVDVTSTTTWGDVNGASFTNGEIIEVRGTARDGSNISSDYILNSGNTLAGLLTDIGDAYIAADPTMSINTFFRDGKLYVEDTTATTEGATPITLTLTYTGAGVLDLGTIDQNTKRDKDLGLINGTVTGLDVAGTIDGESATGTGQLMRGDTGNTNTDGLTISCTGTSDNIDLETVKITLGVAELFDNALFNITDSIDGYVAFKQDSLQDRITSFDDQIEQVEARLDRKMESMINRFVAMELAMSRIQNQSSWLSGQIEAAFKGWGI